MTFQLPRLSLPIKLLLVLLAVFSLGQFVPVEVKEVSLAISYTLKDTLVFVLPVVIFSFVFACLVSFKDNALVLVLSVIGLVVSSNFIATWTAYGVSCAGIPLLGDGLRLGAAGSAAADVILNPAWQLNIPKLIRNEYALIAGACVGVAFSFFPHQGATRFALRSQEYANFFLRKLFIPIVPLFLLGFIFKMQHEGMLLEIIQTYGLIFVCILTIFLIYTASLYILFTDRKKISIPMAIRNMSPAMITAFGAMSSAAALPLLIQGTERNTGKPTLMEALVPSVVNIHLLGDCLSIPILAMAVMASLGMPLPDPGTFFIFSCYFVLAKFAVAAVPAGGVIVMIPILQTHLGFTAEMSTLILALYMLFDAFITATNVLCNGAFAMGFARVYGRGETSQAKSR